MTSVNLRIIGRISTDHLDPANMPIQPLEGGCGVVTIEPEFRPGLSDLAGFEHVWLLFHLHRSRGASLRVVPFMDVVPRGLFATRAPARPAPIGMSCVRLDCVDEEAGMLHVSEVDLVDGSEIFDIKPYVPRFDSRPDSRTGWMERRQTAAPRRSDDRFSR